ncbi:sulfotransferase family protein [Rhodocaloribacter sp.]
MSASASTSNRTATAESKAGAIHKPDFFIVGAPKCGTTAMHTYLSEHPDVFMAKKERHFFGRDLRPEGYAGPHSDPAWYLSFFEDWNGEKRTGEVSVWYLYSKKAAGEIKAFSPDADIVIMLRNPVDMMYSLYNMFVWVKDLTPGGVIEAETKRALFFEEALESQERRKIEFERQFKDPDPDRDPEIEMRLFHTDAAKYADQVKRYLDVFGREHVHFILYDDFKANPRKVYRNLLRFLDVDPDFDLDFEVVNSNRHIKNAKLHYLLRTHDSMGFLRAVGRVLVPVPVRKKVHRALMQYNVKHKPRHPMHPDTRAFLQEHFREDVERLSTLLDRDLVALWL